MRGNKLKGVERTEGNGKLSKAPTGIPGLDQITGGGLPRGRPTLVCGGAGCGKTLLGMEFLVNGATRYDEPGVFISFEETTDDLAKNVVSLGYDVPAMQRRKQLAMDYVRVQRHEIEETGEYDLEGLFVRLAHAVDSVKARRIVLDTVESLFSGLANTAILRAELRRLFEWIKEKEITAIITGERGEGQLLSRHGIEEYVSDCVIVLDHRVTDQISTRRLRVVKYRGSTHGTNEYPFSIDENGLSVLPITSVGLEHDVSEQRVSSGVPELDEMLGGKGYFRGSTVVLAGTPGTGKTSLAAHFADSTCRRGERCLYLAFEESPKQILRNMRSIGLNLQPHVDKNLLHFRPARPTLHGLEVHLTLAHQLIEELQPSAVVLDPVSNLMNAGHCGEVHSMLLRLLDYLKGKGVTTLMTTLTGASRGAEQTEVNISSLIDTWILLRDIETSSERNRGMYILKSRGMAHSNKIREYRLTDNGFELLDVYTGRGEAVTGSARLAMEAIERSEELGRRQESQRRQVELDVERKVLEAQIAALQAKLRAQMVEANSLSAPDAAERPADPEPPPRNQRRGATDRTAGNAEKRSPKRRGVR